MSDPVRIGIAGAGGFATWVMAPILHANPNVVLQAVASKDPLRSAALMPEGRVHPSYESMMDDPEIDAVYIALSNDLHAPVTEMALRAGKHVLCEKPLGLNVAEVERMQAVALESDRYLLEGFWYRWHPRHRELIARVRAGDFGTVQSVDSGFVFDGELEGNYRLDASRGGGAAYDVMCYAISFAVSLYDDAAPVSAVVEEAQFSDQGADISSRAILTWTHGATASVSGGFTGPERRWGSLIGTTGSGQTSEPCFSNSPESEDGTVLTLRAADGSVRDELRFAPSDPRSDMVSDFASVVAGRMDVADLPMSAQHSHSVATALDLVRAAMPAS